MKQTFTLFAAGLLLVSAGAAHAAQPKAKGEILVLLSSETALPLQDGASFPSGFYMNEFGVPADALQRAGYRLTIATPKGNRPLPDLRSVDPSYFGGNAAELHRIEGVVGELTAAARVKPLGDVIAAGLSRFDAVFIPGGHAPLIDLANNPQVGQVLRHFHAAAKPTAAICHGPIALLAAQDDPRAYEAALAGKRPAVAGNWIYDGYRMTIFSDPEETVFEGSLKGARLRYYPAHAMAQAGGRMNFAPAWQPKVVVDRELITGQNPFSDKALAQALIDALGAQKVSDKGNAK